MQGFHLGRPMPAAEIRALLTVGTAGGGLTGRLQAGVAGLVPVPAWGPIRQRPCSTAKTWP